MPAVEQVLLYWGSTWRGKQVVMHVDNRAIAHGMLNRTIRGASMEILRRCMLLAAEFDLELDAQWIPTKENALADALSRFDYDKVTNLAPQLTCSISTLRNRGFLTYTNRDSSE